MWKMSEVLHFGREFDVYLQFNEFGVGYCSFWLSSGHWIFFFNISLIVSVITFWWRIWKIQKFFNLGRSSPPILKSTDFWSVFAHFYCFSTKGILKRNFSFSSYSISLQAEHVKHVRSSSFWRQFAVYH